MVLVEDLIKSAIMDTAEDPNSAQWDPIYKALKELKKMALDIKT